MEVMFANLHLHSTYSDGGFTPEQLVLIGKSLGHQAMALTDHETDGGCKAFLEVCAREGVIGITGAEFYGLYGQRKMHLTALDFDPTAPSLRSLIAERCRLQGAFVEKGFRKAKEQGLLEDITWQQVLVCAGAGAWLHYGTILRLLRQLHALTPERQAAIREVFVRDPEILAEKPVYPQAADVIRAVRDAGGVIGIAHSVVTQYDYLEKLVDLGMNAIEVCHPNMKPEAVVLAEELRAKRNLYRIGGTDHTGPMGCNGGEHAIAVFHGIDREDYQILIERKLK